MITKNDIEARYGKYDDRVIDFILNINKSIKEETEPEYYYNMFDLLAVQLKLYFIANDQLDDLTQLTSKDNYERNAKSPLIGVIQTCHNKILDVVRQIGVSPMEKAKLNRLKGNKDDESAEQLIDKLIND